MTPVESWTRFPITGRVLLEANAGTGKTHALVHWVLRLLIESEPEVALQDILLVTFTDRACDELRQRMTTLLLQAEFLVDSTESVPDSHRALADWLRSMVARYGDEFVRLRLRLARQSADLAQIRTIHGFCRHCLAEVGGLRAEGVASARMMLTDSTRNTWRRLLVEEAAADFPIHAPFSGPDRVAAALLKSAEQIRVAPVMPTDRRGELARELRDAAGAMIATDSPVHELMSPSTRPTRLNVGTERFIRAALEAIERRDWLALIGLSPLNEEKRRPKGKSGHEHSLTIVARFLDAHRALHTHLHELIGARVLIDFMAFLGQRRNIHLELRHTDLIGIVRQRIEHDPEFTSAVRKRFRHLLIDEFQDTDRDQLAIFDGIHDAATDRLFAMVGDPKQSIYRFRGADLSVYLDVRATKGLVHGRLIRNFRSRPAVVSAVNAVFDRSDAFATEGFTFEPGVADHDVPITDRNHAPAPAILEVQLPQADADTLTACADWIAQSLATGRLTLDRPCRAGDFAVLVRRNVDAETMATALAARGLSASVKRKTSVLNTTAADDLLVLLNALERIDEPETRRAAWLVPWLGTSFEDIHAMTPDEAQASFLMLKALVRSIDEVGLARALAPLLPRATAQALRVGRGAQWQVDSAHLLELLVDTPHATRAVRDRLVSLRGRVSRGEDDDEDWRARPVALEDAVTVSTVHGAKGLEFPIVLLPGLFDRRVARNQAGWVVDDNDGVRWQDSDAAKASGDDDADVAEQRRVAYVALTRATAMNVLFRPGDKPDKKPKATSAKPEASDPMSSLVGPPGWSAFLDEHMHRSPGLFATEPAPSSASTITRAPEQPITVLTRSVPPTPHHVASFSSLSAAGKPAAIGVGVVPESPAADESGGSVDTPAALDALPSDRNPDPELAALGALRGTGFGDLVHHLLEIALKRDDRWPEEADWQFAMTALGLDDSAQRLHRPAITRLLRRVLDTPVGPLPPLRSLASADGATEFAFDLSIGAFSMASITSLLADSGYDECARILSHRSSWRGLLTGSADLVCCVNGRYYVCDYKTNWLGPHRNDYGPDAMLAAMRHGHYRLQYLIYLMALDRHLEQRLGARYRTAEHLGGAVYLFVRGIGLGDEAGVFVDRPPAALINALGAAWLGVRDAA